MERAKQATPSSDLRRHGFYQQRLTGLTSNPGSLLGLYRGLRVGRLAFGGLGGLSLHVDPLRVAPLVVRLVLSFPVLVASLVITAILASRVASFSLFPLVFLAVSFGLELVPFAVNVGESGREVSGGVRRRGVSGPTHSTACRAGGSSVVK